MTNPEPRYSVQCACKRVELDVRGNPLVQVWCHCHSSAKFHQTTPVPVALYPADAVSISKGSDYIKRFSVRKPTLGRNFCKECGFKLFHQPDGVPFRGMVATNLEELDFKPAFHVFCEDARTQNLGKFIEDGLPKFKDQSKEMGGSGEQVQVYNYCVFCESSTNTIRVQQRRDSKELQCETMWQESCCGTHVVVQVCVQQLFREKKSAQTILRALRKLQS